MVVSLVEDPSRELPYLSDKMMVDEDAAGRIARVQELKPRVGDCRPAAGNLHSLLQHHRTLRDGDVDNGHCDGVNATWKANPFVSPTSKHIGANLRSPPA
jgi:hypothetical protein